MYTINNFCFNELYYIYEFAVNLHYKFLQNKIRTKINHINNKWFPNRHASMIEIVNNKKFVNANYFSQHHICPPNYPEMTLKEVDYVCSILNKF